MGYGRNGFWGWGSGCCGDWLVKGGFWWNEVGCVEC